MSEDRRLKLITEIDENNKPVTVVGREIKRSNFIGRGNWDLMASTYEKAFDVMWDYAFAHNGHLTEPLLMLCRHSIELNLKSAIFETTKGEIVEGHELDHLFKILIRTRKAAGCFHSDDDADTHRVQLALKSFQSLDKKADRFRYPNAKSGRIYEGIDIDLEQLYQAHWLITGWSFACSCEAEGYPPADLVLK